MPPAPPVATPQNQLEVFVDNIGKIDKLHDQHPNSIERTQNLETMLVEVALPKTKVAGTGIVVNPR